VAKTISRAAPTLAGLSICLLRPLAVIEQTLTLPCGHTLPNRLGKAAMTEGLADAHDRATPAHQRLYAT